MICSCGTQFFKKPVKGAGRPSAEDERSNRIAEEGFVPLCPPCMDDHIFEARERMRKVKRAEAPPMSGLSALFQVARAGSGHGVPFRAGDR